MPKKPCLLIEPYRKKNLAEIEAIIKSGQEPLDREFCTTSSIAQSLYEHAIQDHWYECIELAFNLGINPNLKEKGKKGEDIMYRASWWKDTGLACKVATLALDRGYKYEITSESCDASHLTGYSTQIVERIIVTSNNPKLLAQRVHDACFKSGKSDIAAMAEKHGASPKKILDTKECWETIAYNGDVVSFRRAMSQGITPDPQFLILAVKLGKTELLRIGISEYHLGMTVTDSYGNDVMGGAIEMNNVEAVALLAAAGYKSNQSHVDTYHRKGWNGTPFAITHPEIAKIILESTCEDAELRKQYAFVIGKYARSADIANVVLTCGVGVSATEILSSLDFEGYVTPTDAIRVYLTKGKADPNVIHKDSRKTILMYSKETSKLALELGVTPATLNAQEVEEGSTALMYAARYADPEWVKLLLTAHADVAVKNKKGQTALHVALDNTANWQSQGCASIIDLLLDHGADVTARDENGETPAFTCAKGFQRGFNALRSLVKHGADVVTVRNNRSQTVLMHANCVETIQFLIDAGVDIDAQDADGWNALMHHARYLSHLKLLVERGANLNLTAKDGKTLRQATREAHEMDLCNNNSEMYPGNGCPEYLETVLPK